MASSRLSPHTGGHPGVPIPEGTGGVTLCTGCNVDLTGSNYVPQYCQWIQRCAWVMSEAGDLSELDRTIDETVLSVEIREIYPLRIIKEIIANILALNAEGDRRFRERHSELVEFVLQKERTGLSSRYRVYAVLFAGPLARFVPVSVKGNAKRRWLVTSIDHWPVAHILSIDEHEGAPLLPCGEITNFADSAFAQRANWAGDLLLGFGHLPFPADFRTWAAVEQDRASGSPGSWGHVEDVGGFDWER